MPVNVNPNSLANLRRGGGKVAPNYFWNNKVSAAIAEALLQEAETDDQIRHYLGKVADFEVTERVRKAVANERADRFLKMLLAKIKKALVNGEQVSIADFARFFVVRNDDSVEVMRLEYGGNFAPVYPTYRLVHESRTAIVKPGSWEGGQIAAEFVEPKKYAAGTVYEYDAVTGQNTVIAGSVIVVDGSRLGIFNNIDVTGVGDDGITRQYAGAGLNIKVAVRRSLRQGETSDLDLVLVPLADQTAALNQLTNRVGLLQAGDEVGSGTCPMAVSEWATVKDREPDQARVNDVTMLGIAAHVAVRSYPQRGRIYRQSGLVWRVVKIPYDDWLALFGAGEAELRLAKAWKTRRTRNDGATIKAAFQPAFKAAIEGGS